MVIHAEAKTKSIHGRKEPQAPNTQLTWLIKTSQPYCSPGFARTRADLLFSPCSGWLPWLRAAAASRRSAGRAAWARPPAPRSAPARPAPWPSAPPAAPPAPTAAAARSLERRKGGTKGRLNQVNTRSETANVSAPIHTDYQLCKKVAGASVPVDTFAPHSSGYKFKVHALNI